MFARGHGVLGLGSIHDVRVSAPGDQIEAVQMMRSYLSVAASETSVTDGIRERVLKYETVKLAGCSGVCNRRSREPGRENESQGFHRSSQTIFLRTSDTDFEDLDEESLGVYGLR